MSVTEPGLLTTAEVAELLGKSVRSVQRMAKAGELPVARKMNGPQGPYLFDLYELEKTR